MEEYELQELDLNLDPPGERRATVEEVCALLKAVLLAGGAQHIVISNETRKMHVVRYALPGTSSVPHVQTADRLLAEFRGLLEVEEFVCDPGVCGWDPMLDMVKENGLYPTAFLCWAFDEVVEWVKSLGGNHAQDLMIRQELGGVPVLVCKDVPSGVLVLTAAPRNGLNSTFGVKTTLPIDATDVALEFGIPTRFEDDERRTEDRFGDEARLRNSGDGISNRSQDYGERHQGNNPVSGSSGRENLGWRAWLDRSPSSG